MEEGSSKQGTANANRCSRESVFLELQTIHISDHRADEKEKGAQG